MAENEEIKNGQSAEEIPEETVTEETPETEEAVPEKTAEEPAKEPQKKKKKSIFNNKKFKYGSLSVVFTIMFIAGIVLINVILNLVLDRFHVEADLTSGSIFTLSDETVDYVSSLDDDISIFVTADKDELKGAGQLYAQTVEFLDKMAGLNSRFTVKYVNLLQDPDFTNNYVETLQNYQVIVQSAKTGRYRILSINDFMKYKLSDGNTYDYSEASMYVSYGGLTVTDYSSSAESQLVSAIMSVSLDDPTVVTFLTGYGESDSSALETILKDNAYVTQTVEIERVEAVPENTDILVIHGPTKDYSLDSITKVDTWLSNDGKYGKDLVFIATPDPAETPNLDEYLAEWGIEVGKGYVLQFDENHAYYTGSPLPVMQDIEMKTETAYYEAMKKSSGTSFIGYYVRPVIKLWENEGNLANVTVASAYGEKCIMFPFTADENWAPSEDSFSAYDVIVEASKVQFADNNEPTYSKVIVCGGDQLFTDYFTTASNYSNGEAALSLFDANSESSGKSISIVEKSFAAETYQIERSTQIAIGITFAVIIPIAIIVIGILVWLRRRRL